MPLAGLELRPLTDGFLSLYYSSPIGGILLLLFGRMETVRFWREIVKSRPWVAGRAYDCNRPIADIGLMTLCETMDIAIRASRKTLPPPTERESLKLGLFFSDDEAERVRRGHIPKDMDDKWFIFFEEGWLYFHRSWTGHCIYGVRLDGSPSGVRVIEAWASRNKDEYNSPGVETDLQMIEQLIATRLLA